MIRSFTVIMDGEEHQVQIKELEEGYEVEMEGITHRFQVLRENTVLYSFLIDQGEVLEADVSFNQDRCELNVRNVPYKLEIFDPRRRIVSQSEISGVGGLVLAPMPGKIIELKVKTGDSVEKGQPVLVIEAMKMQNELNAPLSGIIQEIGVAEGDAVEADQKLVVVAQG